MKVKRKSKVCLHSSSSSSSSSSSPPLPSSFSYKDHDSVLKLLPVTILALALSLPNPDREVLAYLIARSILITTTTPNPSSLIKQHPKTKCSMPSKKNNKTPPKVAIFECGCFDCYTRFWYRWDTSPNRDFIHQVIEAFEDHLVQNESTKKRRHSRGKKRGEVIKMGHFESDFSVIITTHEKDPDILVPETECHVLAAENGEGGDGEMKHKGVVFEEEEEEKIGEKLEMEKIVTVQFAGMSNQSMGLARKVLPDFVGLLNSRLWSLWSPWI